MYAVPFEPAAAADPGVVRPATVAGDGLRLSVVVPCYNVGRLAREAIESVLAQTMGALEVIAVDDGSRDDTLRQILAVDDPRLTCITQANRGLSGARNTGVRHARAPLIGFCDGDDVWFRDKAAKHLAVMEPAPDVLLTFSHSAYLDESGRPTGQLLTTRCRQPTTRDLTARNHVGNGSAPIVRRAAFARAGLFDETLRSCEDMEMWVRLTVRAPGVLRLVPEPLTGYRVRQASLMHDYAGYLAASEQLVERFRATVPGFGRRDADRTLAWHLRVCSRKALSAGDVARSRALLVAALRRCPSLLVHDGRAAALVGLHAAALLLPRRLQTAPYRLGRRMLKRGNARRFGARVDMSAGGPTSG